MGSYLLTKKPFIQLLINDIIAEKQKESIKNMTKNFKGGTSPRIYPWNQSQIANQKSSSPRIYPWGQSKI
jgi:hypothetical protein